ncbi:RNA methyltransferase [Neolewinella aurantiaca]|uniref:RNA methyltransferase n=1 Tax=Neolewinella aurantiaca TaxID=2602767 RepID=A0A5C7F7Q1_9BACT|nr:TrmH family RNA methyltransferase [Neolewinella aurantiaca]TXF86712.1 RNA methyltransferase [Neolewinella aurantiaca]
MRQLEHHEIKNSGKRYPIRLLCPDWRDPRNVGSAFRLADAAGLAGLLLAGSTPQPPNPKIDKTARSTVRSVPYTSSPDPAALLRSAKDEGAYIIALEITDESQSLLQYQLPEAVLTSDQEVILVAGAEDHGVPPELLALCDSSVHLPMFGQNTSMNVAVALGAAVYLLLSKWS